MSFIHIIHSYHIKLYINFAFSSITKSLHNKYFFKNILFNIIIIIIIIIIIKSKINFQSINVKNR
jgi:hypothetical protein